MLLSEGEKWLNMRRLLVVTICAIFGGFGVVFGVNAIVDSDAVGVNQDIRIVKVQIGGKSGAKDELIVLRNFSDEEIELNNWSLRKCGGSRAKEQRCEFRKDSTSVITFSGKYKGITLAPGQEFKWKNASKSGKLSKNYGLALFDNTDDKTDLEKLNKNGKIVSVVSWGDSRKNFIGVPKLRNPTDCEVIVWDESVDEYGFVRQDREECEIVPYGGEKIIINELLPNPIGKDGDDEFIELYNPSDKEVSLRAWSVVDGSKTTKPYIWGKGVAIPAKGYWTVYRKDFKFALNNSGVEAVSLLAPDQTVVDKVTYTQSMSENVSFGREIFDDSWRTSKAPTPNAQNVFPPLLEIDVVRVDKKIYRNMAADFEVRTKGGESKVKVSWDFGNGRKSYKAKTRHTYKETGKYIVKVRVYDGVQEVRRELEVSVRKFAAVKVRIAEIMPNPDGTDTGVEYVRLVNKGKKRVNLRGWSVATGSSSKKLVNHPIREKLIIDVGKMRKITTKRAAISLPNSGGVVELRRPDGSVAHVKKYRNPVDVKSIPENAVYLKRDRQWQWDLSAVPVSKSKSKLKSIKSKKKVDYAQDKEKVAQIVEQAWQNEFGAPVVLGIQTEHQQVSNDKIQITQQSKLDKFAQNFNYLITKTVTTSGRNLAGDMYSSWRGIWYVSPPKVPAPRSMPSNKPALQGKAFDKIVQSSLVMSGLLDK